MAFASTRTESMVREANDSSCDRGTDPLSSRFPSILSSGSTIDGKQTSPTVALRGALGLQLSPPNELLCTP